MARQRVKKSVVVGRRTPILPRIASSCWSERRRLGESPEHLPPVSFIFDGSRQGTTWRFNAHVVYGLAGQFPALAEKATAPFMSGPSRPTAPLSQTRQCRQSSLTNRNKNLSH